MTEVPKHPLFGLLTANPEGCWEASLSFEGHDVEVDLNADDEHPIDQAALDHVTGVVMSTASLVQRCRDALVQDAAEDPDSSVTFYRARHLEEGIVEPDVLDDCLGSDRLWQKDLPIFVQRLRLIRIGLYPHEAEDTFIVDFSISPDVTDYVLSVALNRDGRPTSVTFES